MNPNTAIKIENLSKQYRLGLVGTGTLAHDLNRWWTMNILRKEDPYLKIGETNVLAPSSRIGGTSDKVLSPQFPHSRDFGQSPQPPSPPVPNSQYVWALKDINLEIEKGDVVGIIGKNGAGKSTLLKILSRVTKPTTGTIQYRGRIASLLEVGTGFHPEMTGRENIYMNGSIMGMTRHEITRKLDEIIAFAGVERYIDTPVKRYSSGMTVRLGFAIAAHLEPDILVVDEVLAVGDAEFQKKAIGKMQDVSKQGGRTVLFVSHNMAAVKSLCNSAILLKDGFLKDLGDVNNIVTNYLKIGNSIENFRFNKTEPLITHTQFDLIEAGIKVYGKDYNSLMTIEDDLVFNAKLKQKNPSVNLDITLNVKDEQGQILFSTGSVFDSDNVIRSANLLEFNGFFIRDFFNWGTFYVDLYIVENKSRPIYQEADFISFTLANKSIPLGNYMGREPGGVLPNFSWKKSILD